MSEVVNDLASPMATTQGANPSNSPGAESRAVNREDLSSKATANYEASQNDHILSRGMQTLKVNKNGRLLFYAALNGDWKAVKKILDDDREAMTTELLTRGDAAYCVLHVAVIAAQDQLVENLVKRIPPECKDEMAGMALIFAARAGRLRMVKVLTDQIDTKDRYIPQPLEEAIVFAPMQKEVIWYLARRTTSDIDIKYMVVLIGTGNMDLAFHFARRQPSLATFESTGNIRSPLKTLATMEAHFLSTARFNFWEKLIYKCIPVCWVDTSFDSSNDTKMAQALKQLRVSLWNLATTAVPFIKRIGELKLRHKYSLEFVNLALVDMKTHMETPEILELLLTSGVVESAIVYGTSEIVKLCLKHYPELIWENDMLCPMILVVLKRRHVELFRLLNPYKTIAPDDFLRNANHLMKAIVESPPGCVPADVSGAAFFMQRELQWYKVVKDSVGHHLINREGSGDGGEVTDEAFGCAGQIQPKAFV
ncbi:hypothetical protein ACJRO7_016169 [Eucalyptus globulus]|uniref:Ankyrin repeat family protein n=1 Tax=Eucalyptus globulus TaxID=34317 RepID=A0ABD3L9T1_EUCGL